MQVTPHSLGKGKPAPNPIHIYSSMLLCRCLHVSKKVQVGNDQEKAQS